MATKSFERRLRMMERRLLVAPRTFDQESHVALARELALARMVLDAEVEAVGLIERLEATGKIARLLPAAELKKHRDAQISLCRKDVAELEQRCVESGVTDEDMTRYAG